MTEKEATFTIEHATKMLVVSSRLAESEVQALIADIVEAELALEAMSNM